MPLPPKHLGRTSVFSDVNDRGRAMLSYLSCRIQWLSNRYPSTDMGGKAHMRVNLHSKALVAVCASACLLNVASGMAGASGRTAQSRHSAAKTGVATPFVLATAAVVTSIDPAVADVNQDFTITQNVYDPLVTYTATDPAKLLPALATSWTAKGDTWTFQLRRGVKFQDGQPFTSADVSATLARMKAIGEGVYYMVSDVISVGTPSKYTVTMTTSHPTPFLPANLTKLGIESAYDIHHYGSDGHDAESWFGSHSNGTGPYKLESYTPGVKAVLVRNRSWWGRWPKYPVNRVVDEFVVTGSERFTGLKGGTYDLAAFVPIATSVSLKHNAKFRLVVGNNLWQAPSLELNSAMAPTNNHEFRSALAAAFDYNAIIKHFHGYGTVARGPVPSWVPGSADKKLPPVKQNLALAKRLMAKSGLHAPSITCAVPTGQPTYSYAASVLAASAAEIGVTVHIETLPFTQAIEAIKSNKVQCFALGEANLSPTDPMEMIASHYLPGGFYNVFHFNNGRFNKLAAIYSSTFSAKKRFSILYQMTKILVTSHVDLWVARPKTVVPEPKCVTGYKITPANYINVDFAQLSFHC